MASLALMAAVVMFSLWGMAVLALVMSLAGLRVPGAVCGALSIAGGVWLLMVLPHVPLIALPNLACGWVAVSRYMEERRKEEK